MRYLTIRQMAERWGVSERTVSKLCSDGRVEGAEKFGSVWSIPETVQKPIDPRRQRKQPAAAEPLPPVAEKLPHTAMPLLNTSFAPGSARQTAERFADDDTRSIALAEYYYFSGQPALASELAGAYLTHEDTALRVSACWLYAYANLALDRTAGTKKAMDALQQLFDGMDDATPLRDRALITCASTAASVLLHLPLPKILTPLKTYIHMMPPGLRLFVLYVEAHHAYLNRHYGVAVGIAETALALESEVYPIPAVYLHLVACMAYMNLRHPEIAREHLRQAWALAQPDDLIEPIGEHHSLLGGTLEGVLKKDRPDDFKRIIAVANKFSAGWRRVHNLKTGNSVADNLTATEFAASMLAARGWTNREIADHMGLSEYTVRHYISISMQKLNIRQRDKLAGFMMK